MKLIVDTREPLLYQHLNEITSLSETTTSSPQISKRLLEIGDIQIMNDDETETYLVIERKTSADVASSLSDGRWSEQKKRALAQFPCTKLLYIIEVQGPSEIFHYRTKYSKVSGDSILSAVMNLTLNHQIPFLYLQGTENIAKYLYRLCVQYHKKVNVYDKNPKETTNDYDKSYIASISSKKNKNMSPETYFLFCLQGVPGISYKTAKNISELFDNCFLSFLDTIRDHPESMVASLYKQKHGRSLPKTILQNVYQLFLSDPLQNTSKSSSSSSLQEQQQQLQRTSTSSSSSSSNASNDNEHLGMTSSTKSLCMESKSPELQFPLQN